MSSPSLFGKVKKKFLHPVVDSLRTWALRWDLREGALTERWDREWLQYFLDEDIAPFVRHHSAMTLALDVRALSAREVHATRLTQELPPLHIFMPGARLVNGRIFEVGCGPGLVCKQLGLIAEKVVGIDHSRLALRFARYASPPTCSYYLSSDAKLLESQYGTFDCMVCRYFFIHQNYHNSLQLLGLAGRLLKRGGMVGADFYMHVEDGKPAIVFPARGHLSKIYPSCAFEYTEKEIEELAIATGFAPVEMWVTPEHKRRFVLLERQ
jgi:SAM-dependent methyltransferase